MKKRADKSGARVDGGQVGLNATATRFVSAKRLFADALPLEMVPDKLIRVQLGRIAWQEMQLQAPLETLNILRHGLGDVRRVAVEDQEHGTLAAAHEVLEQLQEPRGIKPLGVDLVTYGTAGSNGRGGPHALTPTVGR